MKRVSSLILSVLFLLIQMVTPAYASDWFAIPDGWFQPASGQAVNVREFSAGGAWHYVTELGSGNGMQFGNNLPTADSRRDGWYLTGANVPQALGVSWDLAAKDATGNLPSGTQVWFQLECPARMVPYAQAQGLEVQNFGTDAQPNWFVRVLPQNQQRPEWKDVFSDVSCVSTPAVQPQPAPYFAPSTAIPGCIDNPNHEIWPGTTLPRGAFAIIRETDRLTGRATVWQGAVPNDLWIGPMWDGNEFHDRDGWGLCNGLRWPWIDQDARKEVIQLCRLGFRVTYMNDPKFGCP